SGLGRARNLLSQSRSARAESAEKPSSGAGESAVAATPSAGLAAAGAGPTGWARNRTAVRHANTLRTKRRIEILLEWCVPKYIALRAPCDKRSRATSCASLWVDRFALG